MPNPSPVTTPKYLPLATLTAVFFGSLLIVDPRGDFPLNDDWSFAATARLLAHAHDWRPVGWGSMPLITQSLWALPVCVSTACSYEVLRGTTLVAAFVQLLGSYFLFSTAPAGAWLCALATAVVVFNPIMYELSFTFMTDVLFSALLGLSVLAGLRILARPSAGMFVVFALLAIFATLCRQLEIAVPLALLLTSLARKDRRLPVIGASFLVLALCLVGLKTYEHWMSETGRLPALYYLKTQELLDAIGHPLSLLRALPLTFVSLLLYLGLFSLPVIILTTPAIIKTGQPEVDRRPRVIAVRWLVFAGACLLLKLGPMPVGGNILIPQGLGPLTLRDTFILRLPNVAPLPTWFWLGVTAASVFGSLKLLERVLADVTRTRIGLRRGAPGIENPATFFAFSCLVIYAAPLLATGFADRYLLPILPVAVLFLLQTGTVRPESRYRLPLAATALAGLIGYAVLGTHDYLAWNRARWAAVASVEAKQIDGGFEYNGSKFYQPDYQSTDGKSWWWVQDDLYEISSGPVPGYSEVGRVAFRSYLPPGERYIFILKR